MKKETFVSCLKLKVAWVNEEELPRSLKKNIVMDGGGLGITPAIYNCYPSNNEQSKAKTKLY
jgi:hypothetical protein